MKLRFFYLFFIFGIVFCKGQEKNRIYQKTESNFEEEEQEDENLCAINTIKVTFKGLIGNELIETGRNGPLVYQDMKCNRGFSLKLGKNIELPIGQDLFEVSELDLEEKTLVFEDVEGFVNDVEYVALKKGGLCVKNYKTIGPCKGRTKEECSYYEAYEEEIFEVFMLSVEVNDVLIYSSDLELVFNRDYELKWKDDDLLSDFWIELQNNKECADVTL